MQTPRISIVIVNFNTSRLLRSCLESIYAGANGVPFEIWVVDNDSCDGSVAAVRSLFPSVRVIANRSNVGFSRANNLAISRSRSEYVLLLNPDTRVISDAVERVMRYMEGRPEVGIAGCKVLNTDGTLQMACRRSIPTPRTAFFRLIGLSRLFPNSRTLAKYNLSYLNADQTCEVGAVSGAFLMIRRQTVRNIGLLDERFFMYGEELDWCLRARQAGWKVMYYPAATIIHHKGGSTIHNTRKAAFEFYRAMYLFHRKHYAGRHSPITNSLVYAGIFCAGLLAWRKLLLPPKAPLQETAVTDGESPLVVETTQAEVGPGRG